MKYFETKDGAIFSVADDAKVPENVKPATEAQFEDQFDAKPSPTLAVRTKALADLGAVVGDQAARMVIPAADIAKA